MEGAKEPVQWHDARGSTKELVQRPIAEPWKPPWPVPLTVVPATMYVYGGAALRHPDPIARILPDLDIGDSRLTEAGA